MSLLNIILDYYNTTKYIWRCVKEIIITMNNVHNNNDDYDDDLHQDNYNYCNHIYNDNVVAIVLPWLLTF